jgi:hypothetical protein
VLASLSCQALRQFSPSDSDENFEPSLDAFYRLTPSLNAALTINTDFSATEVDNRQVNLGRFNLFFSEKRDFFNNATYLFQFGNISGMAGGNSASSGGVNYRNGDFFNGERVNVNGSFTWNQSRYFSMSLHYDWNDIELPQGDFTTRLSSVNSQVAFSPNLYWISLIQYDNVSEEIGINTRLQWVPRAGQEAFIVLNHNMQDFDQDNRFNTAFSELSLKFRYTFRF